MEHIEATLDSLELRIKPLYGGGNLLPRKLELHTLVLHQTQIYKFGNPTIAALA